MAKSSVSDILAAQRAVQALDRKGKLAILNDLMKQDLTPKKKEPVTYKLRQDLEPNLKAGQPITYREGGE